MKAEIITIGDEILIGQIIDTNSAWIAEQFNLSGIEIHQITSVHDDREQILQSLENAAGKVDLVVLTGGLGPTKDDITKNTLCAFFQTKLAIHPPTLEHIRERFQKRGIDMNHLNHDQALVPENCTVLPNKSGTAPGMWFEKGNTIFVSVPGVPFEMKELVQSEILPRLKQRGITNAIFHKTVLTYGLPESMLAERIEPWESALPANIKLAYLPNPMAIRLRLSAIGDNQEELRNQVEAAIERLKPLIPDHIFGYNTDTLAGVVGQLLKAAKCSLAVAESCTGGFISHLITSEAGSSEYFKGSVTAYSNEAKQQLLGVGKATLMKNGAVSEPVAREMARGVKEALKSDYAIATTGIAGPGGGSDEKPVGTVWIAVAGPETVTAEKYQFGDNRRRNIIRSSQTALRLLRKMMQTS